MKKVLLSPMVFAAIILLSWGQSCSAVSAAPSQKNPGPIELATGWRLYSAAHLKETGTQISQPAFDTSHWHPIRRMPATVLEILEEDGVYPNLYFGENMLKTVPQDLYKQDWWYRTTFNAPAGWLTYRLEFPGINYRADIWLNGHLLANNKQVVGMYVAHEIDATRWIHSGKENVLAVKVTPEQKILGMDGVELADSWHDWINWKYLGVIQPGSGNHGVSFVPDRNAGVWKPVTLRPGGAIAIDTSTVNTELPLPATSTARLTAYVTVHNLLGHASTATVKLTISRNRKKSTHLKQKVQLAPGEVREVTFTPSDFPQLVVHNPDLWWPYTMGKPNLYDLRTEITQGNTISAERNSRFGIRVITQHRDHDEQFPSMGNGGSFYLTVNGKDLLIRGAVYSPDLLYKYDPAQEDMVIRYVKDMGMNMLRWESKISSEHILDLADKEGIPVMMGWMCCAQWETWSQWDIEDHRVAVASLQSQIAMLRTHASAAIWANGSDGLPPAAVLKQYHDVLHQLHWQNAVVDTVSSLAKDSQENIIWSGIHMRGPYTWRAPTYWFSGKYAASRGACAEQGDNEHIPTYEGLQKFIPKEKLWPINDMWFFHAGANKGNNTLENITHVINKRYGPSTSAEEFARKAQLAHYEDARAQFESFAAGDWADHKMTLYWMLNDPWPSFFGHLFDYFMQPGGAYFGTKKGLRPLSVVFDSYATGDRSIAKVTATNQTNQPQKDLRVRVRIYDLQGALLYQAHNNHVAIAAHDRTPALDIPRPHNGGPAYFTRCQLLSSTGKIITENVYWQSSKDDDVGPPANDRPFSTEQVSWADFTSLASMPHVQLHITAHRKPSKAAEERFAITLHNPTRHIAFFERAELLAKKGGDEILPIFYSDNYVTVFPGETLTLEATLPKGSEKAQWIKLAGYNSDQETIEIQ